MALKKIYTENNGVNFANAYHRVAGIICPEFEAKELEILVKIYKDNTYRDKTHVDNDKYFKIVNYLVSSEDFDTYFTVETLKQSNVEIRMKAYQFLKDKIEYYSDAMDI